MGLVYFFEVSTTIALVIMFYLYFTEYRRRRDDK